MVVQSTLEVLSLQAVTSRGHEKNYIFTNSQKYEFVSVHLICTLSSKATNNYNETPSLPFSRVQQWQPDSSGA